VLGQRRGKWRAGAQVSSGSLAGGVGMHEKK
jgi:hypothetical protein